MTPEPEITDLVKKEPTVARKRATKGSSKRTQLNVPPRSTVLSRDAKWVQYGATVAGGNGNGSDLNQLWAPSNVFVGDDQNVYVADPVNDRIVEWKAGAKEGRLAAGGGEVMQGTNKLASPSDVIIDKKTDSLIICDTDRRRVIRWRRTADTEDETIATDIDCKGLTIDENGTIYVTDNARDEVVRYDIGDSEGTIVAGGNGKGDGLNQLNSPYCVFVDKDYSVYVSDEDNHRVMKWTDGAIEGIVVAGGQGDGDSLSQLKYPRGVIVDQFGTLYVSDCGNMRIMRWFKGATQGDIIAGGNGDGEETNQLARPIGLSFDSQGNLYVVDAGNARVQKFDITGNY
ncbi:unnamed protein product [Rotaria sp. Silwood2]|nr:unnamed protein product [Rotaria sp. Silwood2]CAF2861535.1 unnamed protein product [Rotaria sp. Silwood2]CAF3241246.1 unnamed protein product [Rotaria sp. Silwood2]CAF3883681.1 unnamed protein product [Rotaria sp. Silwood2]CAF4078299.1 unnamed protein product [Rotaria sp. Silwood2]